jgi:hypothetical protein
MASAAPSNSRPLSTNGGYLTLHEGLPAAANINSAAGTT